MWPVSQSIQHVLFALKSIWTEYAFHIAKIFFGTEDWALVLYKKYIKQF